MEVDTRRLGSHRIVPELSLNDRWAAIPEQEEGILGTEEERQPKQDAKEMTELGAWILSNAVTAHQIFVRGTLDGLAEEFGYNLGVRAPSKSGRYTPPKKKKKR